MGASLGTPRGRRSCSNSHDVISASGSTFHHPLLRPTDVVVDDDDDVSALLGDDDESSDDDLRYLPSPKPMVNSQLPRIKSFSSLSNSSSSNGSVTGSQLCSPAGSLRRRISRSQCRTGGGDYATLPSSAINVWRVRAIPTTTTYSIEISGASTRIEMTTAASSEEALAMAAQDLDDTGAILIGHEERDDGSGEILSLTFAAPVHSARALRRPQSPTALKYAMLQ